MRKALKYFLSASLVAAIGLSACKQANTPETPEIEFTESFETGSFGEKLANARKSAKLVGAGTVVMRGGEIIASAVSGEKQYGKGIAIAEDELWHIGSITKSFTSTMLARLVEQDVLSFDTTISDVFGTDDIDPAWHDVTLTQLLTHTSGAKGNFPMTMQFSWPKTDAKMIKGRAKWVGSTLKKAPEIMPGSEFAYSNVGYTIAGVMAEELTGTVWEDLIRREVAEPLGLESLGFGPPKSDTGPVAWGHTGTTAKNPNKPGADNSPIMGPAGIIHMTLSDLAKYGQAHLEGMTGSSNYLKAETFQILHTDVMDNYSMGWEEDNRMNWANGKLTWHNGSNTMWVALLVISPEHDLVYAMATNDGSMRPAQKEFFKLIEGTLPEFSKTE